MLELQEINHKIISFTNLHKWVNENTEKKLVLVGGCFDIIHFGHLTFLSGAKKLGGFLTVILESDDFIKRNKFRQPIHNQMQRAQILASLTVVDAVILLPLFKSDHEYFKLVAELKPKVIAVTQNDPNIGKKQEQSKAVGADVKVVSSFVKGFTSSKIAVYAPISGN